MKEKLENLLAAHKEARDVILDDNTVRIAKIQAAFVELKKEAILVNKESVQKKWHYPDLEKVFLVSKILSPTEGHWETLIIKALYFPIKMSGNEIFEIGRSLKGCFPMQQITISITPPL